MGNTCPLPSQQTTSTSTTPPQISTKKNRPSNLSGKSPASHSIPVAKTSLSVTQMIWLEVSTNSSEYEQRKQLFHGRISCYKGLARHRGPFLYCVVLYRFCIFLDIVYGITQGGLGIVHTYIFGGGVSLLRSILGAVVTISS